MIVDSTAVVRFEINKRRFWGVNLQQIGLTTMLYDLGASLIA